jgi:hypothetical protein
MNPAAAPTHQVSESPGLVDQNITKPAKNETNVRISKCDLFADIFFASAIASKSVVIRNRQPKIPVVTPCLNVKELINKKNPLANR